MYFGGAEHRLTSLQLAIADFPTLQLGNSQTALKSVADKVFSGEIKRSDILPNEAFGVYNSVLLGAISTSDDQSKFFKNNLTRFAAAKTKRLIRDLDRQRADINGEVRTKAEYDIEAKKIINTQNRFLAVEHNTAVHRFRVAKQWETFLSEKYLYPNIEWLRTRSAEPRGLHLQYVGRVWSMDDDFFKKNQPGCLFECKCSWKTTDAPVTDNSDIKTIAPDLGLEGNPYYTNEIFTDNHSYFAECPSKVTKLGVLRNPDDIVYLDFKTKSGNNYSVHYNEYVIKEDSQKAVSESSKVKDEHISIAESLADSQKYSDIKLLPKIHQQDKDLRIRYLGAEYLNKFGNTNPDAIINGKIAEFKLATKNTMTQRICEASEQSDFAVIKLRETLTEPYINNRIIKGIWTKEKAKGINTITVINGNSVIEYKRP